MNSHSIRRRPVACKALWILSYVVCSESVIGQDGGAIKVRASSVASAVMLEPPAPIANLFSQAEDGIARGDWKLVIDSLQRVIDDPEGAVMDAEQGATPEGGRYVSARLRAMERIASLPQEGLDSYRLLYDGVAKGLLERARAGQDLELARSVVTRFLPTRYGDDAADFVASRALDEGRPLEVVHVLQEMRAMCPDYDVPESLVSAKLALAYRLLGHDERAVELIDSYRNRLGAGARVPEWLESIADRDFTPLDDREHWTSAEPEYLEPSLAERVPWRFELDRYGGTRTSNRPRGQLAHDGQDGAPRKRYFVRTELGVAALSVEDLALLWEWPAPRSEEALLARAQTGALAARPSSGVRGSVVEWVTHSRGLVLAALLAPPEETEKDAPRILLAQQPRQQKSGSASIRLPTTQLAAWDAETGRLRWKTYLTDPPTDGKNAGESRGPALSVGDALWIPMVHQQEFSVAVLDPATGHIRRRIVLCSLVPSQVPSRAVLQGTLSGGVVYMPSDQGYLFAIDAQSFSIRWAAWFGPTRMVDPATWVSSPPTVVGERVIFAPPDRPEIFVLSALDGTFEWSAPLEIGSQLIDAGADGIFVSTGPQVIDCLSLANGETRWRADLPSPRFGNAVSARGSIYVPVEDGLMILARSSGATLASISREAGEAPLGHLLATDDSIISLEAQAVRRLPDIKKALPKAKQMLAANPSSPGLTAQVAWLQWLMGDPEQAVASVSSPALGIPRRDSPEWEAFNRIRVEALLSLANASKTPADRALVLLNQASESATAPADRVRCVVALAEHSSRDGRHSEAFNELWNLGVSSDSERLMTFEDGVVRLARIEIARQLRSLHGASSESERAAWQAKAMAEVEALNKTLATSEDTSPLRRLRAIAELDLGPASQRALLALADWETRFPRFEQAEVLLREAARREADSGLAAQALMRLCDLYLTAPWVLTAAAQEVHAELVSRFGSSQSPIDGSAAAVAEYIESTRRKIDAASIVEPPIAQPPANTRTQPLWIVAKSETIVGPRLVMLPGDGPSALADRLIAFGSDEAIHGIHARTGAVLWSSPLLIPEKFPEATGREGSTGVDRQRRAVSVGQVGVFNGTDGLFAVGMVTGKRLWAAVYEPPTDELHPRGDSLMAIGDGVVAAMPRWGRLSLHRLTDGSVLWERELHGERVGSIMIHQDRVITIDPAMERVQIFDITDGRAVGRATFRQNLNDVVRVALVRSGGVLCGPLAAEQTVSVVGVDLKTGAVRWQEYLERPTLKHLFVPKDGFVGLSLLEGTVRIISAETGQTALERDISGGHGVADALLVDGALLVREINAAGQPSLIATDVATGESLWIRKELAGLNRWNQPLRTVGGAVPLLVESPGTQGKPKGLSMILVDYKTGLDIGPPLTVNPPDSGGMEADWVFRPGILAVGTSNGIRGYRLESTPPARDSAPAQPQVQPGVPEGAANGGGGS